MKRRASATWQGDLKTGKGTISTQSGAMKDNPYGFNTRFEDAPGTNPEELVGAAHAGCYAMAMTLGLADKGVTADQIDAKAQVTLDEVDGGFAVTKVHLDVTARIPGISAADFQEVAEATKKNCPISKLLNAEITLDAKLES
ncbi:OsmC family protein [Pseudohalocynthiibacter aestuariivivens]|uniref:OsmC family protein n=1 Tax=Roseovarius pelagicus TaxID=2980108 RepID=A0ABY6DD15_9RHOB|nr:MULTISPECIES: OsmC family protein [Rhodobacterales]QIE44069.1 OsmC family protein [Pseudohalocynthiibacter aestuariivivens]UXX84032.1 OsmC family protein [Roseovarius pelagicus]